MKIDRPDEMSKADQNLMVSPIKNQIRMKSVNSVDGNANALRVREKGFLFLFFSDEKYEEPKNLESAKRNCTTCSATHHTHFASIANPRDVL